MRYVRRIEKEKKRLEELQKTSANALVRRRCLCLLLSTKNNSIIEVSIFIGIDKQTVRRLIHKWDAANEQNKFSVLFPQQGQGAKVKLAAVADILLRLIEQHNQG